MSFYVQYNKATNRVLNWGSSPIWSNQQELETKHGKSNIAVLQGLSEEAFNQASEDIPGDEILKVNPKQKQILQDNSLKQAYLDKISEQKQILEKSKELTEKAAKESLGIS